MGTKMMKLMRNVLLTTAEIKKLVPRFTSTITSKDGINATHLKKMSVSL